MKTYLLHHTPKTANQDTWAFSFSLPYIALSYARGGDGVWYIKTWLTADQIHKRLAILLDSADELRVHELGREVVALNRLQWLSGRLEDDDNDSTPLFDGPRAAWSAFQTALSEMAAPVAGGLAGARPRDWRAA